MQNHSRINLIIMLCLSFFFGVYFFFFTQGFAYEIDDVLAAYALLKNVSYLDLLKRIFSPFSFSIYTAEQYEYIFVRITECLFYKDLLQDHLTRIHIYNLVQTVLMGLLIYRLSQKLIGSRLGGLLCALFLMMTPAFGWSIYEYGDSTPADLLLLLGFFLLLIREFERIRVGENVYKVDIKVLRNVLFLWIIGMLTIRTKPTNLVMLPPVTVAMTLFYPGTNLFSANKEQRRGLLALLFVGIYCGLPLIFTDHNSASDLVKRFFDLKNLYYIFILNPQGWQAENTPILFRLNRQLPTTILAQFGFLLSWIFILSSAYLGYRKISAKKQSSNFSANFFLGAWLLSASIIYILGGWTVFTRHMIYLLVPAAIIVFRVLFKLCELAPAASKPFLVALLSCLILAQTADNTRHSLFLRDNHIKIWGSKWVFRDAIFQDREGRKPKSLYELHTYWGPWPEDLWDMSHYFDARSDLPDFSPNSDFGKLLERHGRVYLATHQTLSNIPLLQHQLLVKMNPAELSMLSKWTAKMKNKTEWYYLYRIEKKPLV